jgi:glycine betaine catabolism A
MLDRIDLRRRLERCEAGYTLPREFYIDSDIYEFDVDEVLARAWVMAAFEAELPQAGSYVTVTLGNSSIILVRDHDAKILAFHNTCRHRGARICADGAGRVTRFVCPYHKWTYDLQGALLAAPRMGADFPRARHALRPVRTGVVGGCVYVALSEEAPDFAPFQEAVEPLLAPYRLGEAKVAAQSTLIERANWKLVMENARECLHCAASHPELKVSFPAVIGSGFDFSASGNQEYLSRSEALGLPTQPVGGAWWHAGRYPLNPGCETISPDGNPVVTKRLSPWTERGLGGLRWATEANNFCHVLPDHAFLFSAFPTGPRESVVTAKWLVHRDAEVGRDYTLEGLMSVWTQTNLQDRALAENNQRGVDSVGYQPGPYSPEAEDFVIRFSDWYRQAARAACAGRQAAPLDFSSGAEVKSNR